MTATSSHGSMRWIAGGTHRVIDRATEITGGPARFRVIVLLACVIGLDGADKGALGAVAPQLERALHIDNIQIGLLVTVSSLAGAAAALPLGALADRTSRRRILIVTILIWCAAMVVSGLAVSYPMLLVARLALGAVTGAVGPCVASLIGDLFAPEERGRIYGYILTGELLGAGFGILIAGYAAAIAGWRAAFFALAVPSLLLPWALWRLFTEPVRGGQSRLRPGYKEVPSSEEVGAHPDRYPTRDLGRARTRPTSSGGRAAPGGESAIRTAVTHQDIEPDAALVLRTDPSTLNLWQVVRYVLSVHTNVLLIVVSALGYFFFAGLRTFALVFMRGHYGIGQATATSLFIVVGAGAVGGILVAGRLADGLLGRGRINARIEAAAAGFLLASVLFVPAILSRSLLISIPIYVVAAAALASPNPSVDAARLDVMPSRLWGRAEAVRTAVRAVFEAFAPLLFGVVSQLLGSGHASGFGTGVNANHAPVSAQGAHGLGLTFLIMLVPLAASGLMLLRARRYYPTDIATAAASEDGIREALAGNTK